MVSYGFFLPLKDAVEIRATSLGWSVEKYLLKTDDFEVPKKDMEKFKKDPISYWIRHYDNIPLERNRNYRVKSWSSNSRNIVFVGYLTGNDFRIMQPLDDLLVNINKDQIRTEIEELGFGGYELKYYIGNQDNFRYIEEKDIQERNKNKM